MNLTPNTYAGHNINDGTAYAAKLPDLQVSAKAGIISVDRTGNFPVYGGIELDGAKFRLQIDMRGTASLQYDTIRQWFDPARTPPSLLAATDANTGKQWQMYAAPVRFVEWKSNFVEIELWAADPTWQSVTNYGGTITTAAASAGGTLTTAGNAYALPTIAVVPSSYPTGGYGYKRDVILYNRSPYALTNYPIELSGTVSGWDTSTLVGAGKMQADGDDIRVIVDGNEVDYWLANINSGTTKVWANLTYLPAQTMTLKTAIANTGVPATIDITNTTANVKALGFIPAAGLVMIDSELFAYSAKNTTKQQLTVSARAVKGTIAASHSTAAVIRFIDHDIYILYGNSSAAAPDVDNTWKPIINLTTSTNASHVFAEFWDSANLRSGAWKPAVVTSIGKQSLTYTATQAASADPATAMGAQMNVYLYGTTVRGETADISWTLDTPCLGTAVTSAGNKYLYSLTSAWPAVASLQSSATGATWVTEWTETKPSTANVWQAWTHSAEAITGTGAAKLRFSFKGGIGAIASNAAAFETTSATITYNANYTPVVTLGAEQQNYWYAATITNSTTGEGIDIAYPMTTGGTLLINTEQRTVTYNGVNALAAVTLDSVRNEWLKLSPGDNVIAYTTTSSGGTVAMTWTWKDRMA